MHHERHPLAALAAAILCAGSGAAVAQSCNAPVAYPSEPNPVSGTTCGGESIVLSACSQVTVGPSFVFSLSIGSHPTAEFQLSSSPPTRLQLMLIGEDCNGDVCHGLVTSDGGVLSLAEVPPGRYNLVVTTAWDELPDTCGPFSILLTGSVGDDDLLFADGFD